MRCFKQFFSNRAQAVCLRFIFEFEELSQVPAAYIMIALLLCLVGWFPQEKPSPPGNEVKDPRAVDPAERAAEILDYVATLVPNLPPEAQVSVYWALADTVWPRNSTKARDLFRSAFMALAKIDVSAKPKDRQEAHLQQQLTSWKRQTRQQLLSRVAQLDAELAKELARQSGEKDEPSSREEDIGFSFQRAYELLSTDPAQAAALAQHTLAVEVNPWIIEFLFALRQRAPELADRLFETALSAILSRSHPPDVMQLHLLGPYALSLLSGTNPLLGRRFLELMAVALQAQFDPAVPFKRRLTLDEQRHLLRLYLPSMERYMPEWAALLQALLNQSAGMQAAQQPSQSPSGQGGVNNNTGSNATGEPSISHHEVKGAGGLLDPEATAQEAAKSEAAILKIKDEKLRQALLDARREIAARQALGDGKFDEAYRITQQIENPLKQISLLVEMGLALAGQGDKGRAIAFFDRAVQLIAGLDNRREGVFHGLMLARAAPDVDRDKAWQYAQQAVTRLNRFHSSQSADVDRMTALMNRQWFHVPIESLFLSLGRADFDQAIYLAMQLHNTEHRLLAEIAACRAVLKQAEKKSESRDDRD